MKTNDFYEELKAYFENTAQDKVMTDWAATEEYDSMGPTVDEFLFYSQKYYKVHLEDLHDIGIHFIENNLNPEFTSGFFNYKNLSNAKSCVLN